jgi:MoaA/NifB/PqqE/SkfB family radical SAM enzyme
MAAYLRPRALPIPSLEWELTTRCNYDCSYCTQRRYAGLRWGDCGDDIVDAVLALLRTRTGSWLVKLSGGEPFLHPRFLEVAGRIASLSHRVATTTNFSVPPRVLQRLIDVCGTGLDFLTASVHPEQVRDLEGFVEKARWFQSVKPAATRFVVTTVGIESDLPRLRMLAERFDAAAIPFEIAPLKDGMVYATYTDPEFIRFMESRPLTHVQQIRGSRMLGTFCHTGSQFARITVDGDVLRCYNLQPRFALGHVVDGGIRWLDGPKPCLAGECTCTVPANRNMIEFGRRADAGALAWDAASALVQHGPAFMRLTRRWLGRALFHETRAPR